jgi:putative tricarboxylic transport membrane protein
MGGPGGDGQVHDRIRCQPRRRSQGGRARQIKVNDALTGAALAALAAARLGLCGVALIASGLRQRAPLLVLPDWLSRQRPRAGVAAVIAGLLAYILLADRLGFHIVGAVLLAVWMRVLGASWRIALPGAAVFTVLIHLAFYKALRVPLPWGLLERWAF